MTPDPPSTSDAPPATFDGRARSCARSSSCDRAVATFGAPLLDCASHRGWSVTAADAPPAAPSGGAWIDDDDASAAAPAAPCPRHWASRFVPADAGAPALDVRRLGSILLVTRADAPHRADDAIRALRASVANATAPALTELTVVVDARSDAPPVPALVLDFGADGVRDVAAAAELMAGRSRALDPQLPVRTVSLLATRDCAVRCGGALDSYARTMLDTYVGRGAPFDGQRKAAIIDLDDQTYDDYIAEVKRHGKGSALRQAKKAVREGYVFHPFERALHVPDIVDINHSMPVRSGGAMRSESLGTVESMGGAPTQRPIPESDLCPAHARRWWGAFLPEPGHSQGAVTTDERLVAYISLSRMGDLVLYSLILGHGDHLRHGVMFQLHFTIMAWILARDEPFTRGIRTVVYAGYYQGTDGLRQWKRNTAFSPAYLVIDPAEISAIEQRRNAPTVRLARGAQRIVSSVRRRGRRLIGRDTP